MIKVDEALQVVLESINSLPSEEVDLSEALDRVSAKEVCAPIDVPQLDNSAMDGYAVRASDICGASLTDPKILDVIDDIKAGYVSSRSVGKGQAARIMTGAVVPQGADTVVMVEKTEKAGQQKVKIFEETALGKNIRRRGEDTSKGKAVIGKGTSLGSAQVGILASLGISKVEVTMRPKVAVLATGDEVIDVGEKLDPGKLYSSNTYTLCAQIQKAGGVPKNLGIAKDAPRHLEAKLREGFDCDVILTSGGVSVGDYDIVKAVLTGIGTEVKFWKVAMKPGKPVVFGKLEERAVFGLPGNPVSSMVSFEVFVRPAILKMLGQDTDNNRNEVNAVLEESVRKKKGTRYFLRAQTRWEGGNYMTRTTGHQGSGILRSVALANSLMVLPEEDEYLEEGSKVTVRLGPFQ